MRIHSFACLLLFTVVVCPVVKAQHPDFQTGRLAEIQRQLAGRASVSEAGLRERAALLRRLMRDNPHGTKISAA